MLESSSYGMRKMQNCRDINHVEKELSTEGYWKTLKQLKMRKCTVFLLIYRLANGSWMERISLATSLSEDNAQK